MKDTVNYCSVLTQAQGEDGNDIFRVIIMQIQKEKGRIFDIVEINSKSADNKIISIPQIGKNCI